MSNRRKIVALLATIAVLLTLNLVQGERRAEAGVQGEVEMDVQSGGGDPYIVKRLARHFHQYVRLWSDGQVDYMQKTKGGCDFQLAEVWFGPSGHPFDVVDGDWTNQGVILRYQDGRVDHLDIRDRIVCTIAGEGSDPFCLGDIDRNGDTNFDDLLFVLRDWGVCE